MAAGLTPAGASPPPDALASAVRAGRWEEVRAAADAAPRPLPPILALLAARAARAGGNALQALALLREALPRAGPLAAACRLDAAEASLALGRDPWPYLQPILARPAPAAQRRVAAALLRRSWEQLSLPTLRRFPRNALPKPLRRGLAMALAVRSGDAAGVVRALGDLGGDPTTLRGALFLAAVPGLDTASRLASAQALLAGGEWRLAQTELAEIAAPSDAASRHRWAFLRGRAAYRLGDLPAAARAFAQAFELASSSEGRLAAATHLARVAELQGDFSAALGWWDAVRTAAPREVEGWDGGARARIALGRLDEALQLLQRAPPAAARVAAPRNAALLLARGELRRAGRVLAQASPRDPAARFLRVAARLAAGELAGARADGAAFLADPRNGEWRELVLDLLPAPSGAPPPPAPSRDLVRLAGLAVQTGAGPTRRAYAAALRGDPAWAALLAGEVAEPAAWTGPAAQLAAYGLERDAAALYPDEFPAAAPADLAWSARRLAQWGNRSAALGAGERLWGRLGGIPASLVPDRLLAAILPGELVGGCVGAAEAQSVPASWLIGLIRRESRFDEGATSAAGALGVAQFVPEAARRLGADPFELRDESCSLALAAREVDRLRITFGARLGPVAAAYNAGEA
ncbi:MAG TPA: transglycosylase SLT domain-containing protein, partial [Thermoanaerobaculaceae bacterium]|nr:transglycosylase SLT domain-containing protein [Thermoanaerobaculaceae bacterium]